MHEAPEPHSSPGESAPGLEACVHTGAPERGAATRQALLDTAERLFAEHGYGATSLRRITAAADANLAAVHYHFGSKQDLFVALFRRRVQPVNRQRVQFTIGSLANVLAQAHRSTGPSCLGPDRTTPELVADELVAYAAAGLRAPVRRTGPAAQASPIDTEPLQ